MGLWIKMMSKGGDCEECDCQPEVCDTCDNCPTPVLKCESRSASKSKCGYQREGDINFYLFRKGCVPNGENGNCYETTVNPDDCTENTTYSDTVQCCDTWYSDGKYWGGYVDSAGKTCSDSGSCEGGGSFSTSGTMNTTTTATLFVRPNHSCGVNYSTTGSATTTSSDCEGGSSTCTSTASGGGPDEPGYSWTGSSTINYPGGSETSAVTDCCGCGPYGGYWFGDWSIGHCSNTGSGMTMTNELNPPNEFSNPYSTAALIAKVDAALGDWVEGACSSYLNIPEDESSCSKRQSRWWVSIEDALPEGMPSGKRLKVTMRFTFTPSDGGTATVTTSTVYVESGSNKTDKTELPIPSSNGTMQVDVESSECVSDE